MMAFLTHLASSQLTVLPFTLKTSFYLYLHIRTTITTTSTTTTLTATTATTTTTSTNIFPTVTANTTTNSTDIVVQFRIIYLKVSKFPTRKLSFWTCQIPGNFI